MNTNYPTIEVNDWQPVGESYGAEDDRAALLATIIVCGCYLHLTAIEVKIVNDQQVAADEACEEALERLLLNDPIFCSTATIDGRDYALFAAPFED